jgi:chemotaxis protein methyltransferase CheR
MNSPLDAVPARVPASAPGTFPAAAPPDKTILSDPVIANLYRRVEQTLGIRAGGDALEKLRAHLEGQYGARCFESPCFYERILTFPEDVFAAARFLTISETYFFRETVYFDLLRQELLPRFARLHHPVRVCSAASSIGCEAYSLAMVMDDFSRTVQPLTFWIDALDVNPDAVEIAKKGRYTANTLREDGARWKFLLDRYTQAEGADFVIDPGLRNQVRFYTHNILDGLSGNHYDLIFFRNALIYFSGDKRAVILDHLADALVEGAALVLGVSETPMVSHPRLETKLALDAFYFQKVLEEASKIPTAPPGAIRRTAPQAVSPVATPAEAGNDRPSPVPKPSPKPRKAEAIRPAEPEAIAALIDGQGGGRPIAEKIPELLRNAGEGGEPSSGDELFAAVIFLLGLEEFSQADVLLSFIEKYDRSAFTHFLRGEYHYFNKREKKAESNYREAAAKNESFWPAFYRLCTLAAEENPVRYEYKTRKALESIKRGKEKRYEIFIGGFSPDYYQRALEKRLQ